MDFDELLDHGDLDELRRRIAGNPAYLNGDYRQRTKVPLVYAADQGKDGLAKLLIELGADVDASDCRGQTALHSSAIEGYPGIAKMLIDNNASLDLQDSLGRTPLMWATAAGPIERRAEVARLLIDNGATYDLNSAVCLGDVDRVRKMLSSDADAVSKAPLPNNLLGNAVWAESLAILQALLSAGADPNGLSSEGRPPLFDALASTSRDPKLLRELLLAGANPELRDRRDVSLRQFIGKDLSDRQREVLRKFGVRF